MAVHKVPQDVEADDKFLGPLSFKQFLFAGGVVIFGYLSFITIINVWFLSPLFIIPTLCFAALAFPWSKEQPTELWLAARIRFLVKPRRRIWDQSGMKDLVKITAPIRPVHLYTDGLTQTDVHSRLNALATMVDSRGWASKNAAYSVSSTPSQPASDRLVAPIEKPVDVTVASLQATEDVLDPDRGTIAKQFDSMIKQSENTRKQHALELVQQARQPQTQTPQAQQSDDTDGGQSSASAGSADPAGAARQQQQDFWFMNNSKQTPQVVAPGSTNSSVAAPPQQQAKISKDEEEALLQKAHEKQRRDAMQTHSTHEKVLQPVGSKQAQPEEPAEEQLPQQQQPKVPVPPVHKPDILNLANSNDLSVQTLAREAKRQNKLDDGEVIISLH